jgi:hypothetical protein|tara:strand:+ start:1819 stop:2082 length:264 start_codon:yes stop_codon:yes gene_type:complete
LALAYNLIMKRFTYRVVPANRNVIRETGIMSDDEDKTYKIIPVPVERDEGGLNAIELMSLYEGLIKENAFLRERVLRLEQRLMEALN